MKTQTGFLHAVIASFCFFSLLPAVNVCRAAEWWLEPSVRLGGEYDDNPGLTTFSHSSVHGTTISPQLDLGVQSYLWQVNGRAQLTRRSYSGENSLGRDSEYYSLSTLYNTTERTSLQLDGSLSYVSNLVSETSADPDVGILLLNKQRKTSSYAPTWTWSMTERTRLQLGYQESSVSYKDGLRFGLFDYNSRAVTAKLGHQLSQQSYVFVNLVHSIFEVPANRFESETNSIQGGMTHSFSDTLSTSFAIGTQKTLSEGIIRTCLRRGVFFIVDGQLFFDPNLCAQFGDIFVDRDSTSSILSASLEKQFTLTRLSAGLSRSLNSSGLGTLVQTDTFNLQISQPFTALLTGSLSIVADDYHSSLGDFTTDDRVLYQVVPGLSWQWTEQLSVSTSLRYSRLKRVSEPQAATGRAVYLSVAYRGTKKSVSR